MTEQKIVTIGGGTGTYTLLTGINRHRRDVTAIVTMSDDGGSSGRLRDEFGHLPPGDARRCLVALSANKSVNRTLRALFEYRFDKGQGLNGHSFGNLFLTALTELTGSLELAIHEAARLLNVRGRVLPVTTDDVRLCATLEDGTLIRGERNIDVRTVKPEVSIRHVFLSPSATAYPPVLEAIRAADIVVIGPGDLFSSIIPNLLVRGVPEAIRECAGTRVFVCNIMTKHGETDGYAASRFVSEVCRYLGSPSALDWAVINSKAPSAGLLKAYAAEHAYPVRIDEDRLNELVPRVVQQDLLSRGSLLRHDSSRLAKLIVSLRREARNDSGLPTESVAGSSRDRA